MNVFVQLLASKLVEPAPRISATKFDVEDNVGESIHIHLRNLRLEMSIEDFEHFADNLTAAHRELTNGNR
ncbi:hypothetical protein [Haladaptatus sp. DYSN1]|uniref:hypothetical protein n=1 Tax=unclassified Haladaptatus TaxID=2622732 RepID=UPI00240543F7|nr:hypothetical protein [Haladaptatus sp. DYSN1]